MLLKIINTQYKIDYLYTIVIESSNKIGGEYYEGAEQA
jgi:hypothetical protein